MASRAKDADNGMLMEEIDLKVRHRYERSWITGQRIALLVLIAVGVVLVIVGIVLLALASSADKECSNEGLNNGEGSGPTSSPSYKTSKRCEFSVEARRIGLDEFVKKVKDTYYTLHPFTVPFHPNIDDLSLLERVERVKSEYVAYDPTPSVIKNRTDISWALLKEIMSKEVNMNALKPRERKSLAQVKHYLQHMFGQPYDVNYYAGDWMMGPNLFCWQPICYHGYDFYNGMIYHKPFNANDVEHIRKKLETHKLGILRYIENMKMGITKGMIRSVEECVAGVNSVKRKYLNVSLYNETGIWKEWFVEPLLDPEFYSNITKEVDEAWKEKHGKNVSETIKDYLLTYLGEPLHQLIRFLEDEYSDYCVPSNVSSGLGSLPLSYVWYKGKENRSWPTDPMLPSGEKLNGSYSYSLIMPYFTTNNMTPADVHELGKKQLSKLYPMQTFWAEFIDGRITLSTGYEITIRWISVIKTKHTVRWIVVQIAKEVIGTNDSDLAVSLFRRKLSSTESFFNDAPIPKNESNKEAHRRCSNLTGAEKYCPKRWAAMQLWFREARRVMSMLDPKTVGMFYFTGPKHTTPNCPIDLLPDLNPSSGAQSYENSDIYCSRNAIYNIPFFLENLGPRFSEWSVNAHESRPGHHTQVQGTVEHFRDSCTDAFTWLDKETYYTAFTEGWALYSENPLIALDTDTYKEEPMQRFGMLKWQLWRAIRLIVDTGLHSLPNFTRDDALWYFDKYAWDNTDLAKKEVTRYQSDPGQATAYMIGQLDIIKSRRYAEKHLKDDFTLPDFHYQVLSQGSSPLAYLSDHIQRYVSCEKDREAEGCDVILNPPAKTEVANRRLKAARWPLVPRPHRHHI